MKHYSLFIEEAQEKSNTHQVSDDIVETFGRHNPPHRGHLETFKVADKIAGSIGDNQVADSRFYTSRSQDPKKNPLPYEMKLHHLKKMFPQYADRFDDDPNVKTVLNAAEKAYGQGYKNFHFVGGSDRKDEIENLLRKYNGKLYDFKNIYSHSAGERSEEDANNPIATLSASKIRALASKGKLDEFLESYADLYQNDGFTRQDAQELYNELRSHMGLFENWELDREAEKTKLRELYKAGHLYEVGDWVESLTFGLQGKIHRCGTNHLICVTENGIMFKNFIHDVHIL